VPQIYSYPDSVGLNSAPYGQAMTTVPGANDDIVHGWCDTSMWQYVGLPGIITMYLCIKSDEGAAQWIALV
jgi:hypothetical protein